jgi:hypothetical protein
VDRSLVFSSLTGAIATYEALVPLSHKYKLWIQYALPKNADKVSGGAYRPMTLSISTCPGAKTPISNCKQRLVKLYVSRHSSAALLTCSNTGVCFLPGAVKPEAWSDSIQLPPVHGAVTPSLSTAWSSPVVGTSLH